MFEKGSCVYVMLVRQITSGLSTECGEEFRQIRKRHRSCINAVDPKHSVFVEDMIVEDLLGMAQKSRNSRYVVNTGGS